MTEAYLNAAPIVVLGFGFVAIVYLMKL